MRVYIFVIFLLDLAFSRVQAQELGSYLRTLPAIQSEPSQEIPELSLSRELGLQIQSYRGLAEVHVIPFSLPEDREDLENLGLHLETLSKDTIFDSSNDSSNDSSKNRTHRRLQQAFVSWDYIAERLSVDEPAWGYVIAQVETDRTVILSVGWYTAFTTWAKDFSFQSPASKKRSLETPLSNLDLSDLSSYFNPEDNQRIFPNIAEISVLIAKNKAFASLMFGLLENHATAASESEFHYLLVDALDSAEGFYLNLDMVAVEARAKHVFGKYSKHSPYHHWLDTHDDIKYLNENPSLLLAKSLNTLEAKARKKVKHDRISTSKPNSLEDTIPSQSIETVCIDISNLQTQVEPEDIKTRNFIDDRDFEGLAFFDWCLDPL